MPGLAVSRRNGQRPALVHIPAGLVHGPLEYKRVDKPIVFLDIYLAPTYERK
jgi:hypothetical protein